MFVEHRDKELHLQQISLFINEIPLRLIYLCNGDIIIDSTNYQHKFITAVQ